MTQKIQSNSKTMAPRSSNHESFLWILFVIFAGLMVYNILMGDSQRGIGKPFPSLKGIGWLSPPPPEEEVLSKKVVVLDFFATWCGPCMMQMPDLIKLYEETRPYDVVFISVTSESVGSLPEIGSVLDRFPGMKWHVGYGAAELSEQLNVRYIPHYALYDPKTKSIVWTGSSDSALRAEILKVVSGIDFPRSAESSESPGSDD